jgi:prepilin-type N-terminal cleavage/methylation domain-containing protein
MARSSNTGGPASARHHENGFTLVELSIVLLVAGVLMAIGATALLRARMSGNEAAAISNLQAIHTGQFAYLSGCGGGYYATSLDRLGAKVGAAEGYISPSLATGPSVMLTGYIYEIAEDGGEGDGDGEGDGPASQDCNGEPTQGHYYASAVPVSLDSTGARSFATSPKGGIWALPGGTPPEEPFGPPAVQAR